MSLLIRPCTIAEIFAASNIVCILQEYEKESSIEGLPVPSAKMEMYKQLESTGFIQTFGAFWNNILIGFITVLSPVMPHYSIRIATAESFFVLKEHRKTGAGLKLLKAAQSFSREIGTTGLLISAPSEGDLAKVLPCVGYRETNRVFFMEFPNE